MTPGGLVEVRVSWPGHPRYLKKKLVVGIIVVFVSIVFIVIIKFLFISLPLSKKPKEELWAIYNNPILWPFYMGQENGPCVINGLDR